MCPTKFLIFMVNKLLDAKTESLRPNKFQIIYIYIYINKKSLHILEMYNFERKKKLN